MHMLNQFARSSLSLIVSIVLLVLSWSGAFAETLRFNPVSRAVIETRLGKSSGDDSQREATLRQLFVEAGCDDQHVSEQPVKGSKLPNVICVEPGSSDKVIIVGRTSTMFPPEME
jgi:hypothetical protein